MIDLYANISMAHESDFEVIKKQKAFITYYNKNSENSPSLTDNSKKLVIAAN